VCADPIPSLDLVLIDLADVGLPPLCEPAPAASGQYVQPATRSWSQLVAEFDAFVLVTPEYNHSTSAALKNAHPHHQRRHWRTPARTRPQPRQALPAHRQAVGLAKENTANHT
jgi:NAD(P)H-dependent FMN reductase